MSCVQVIWKGEEIWLESELKHFSLVSKAKAAWKRATGHDGDGKTLPQGPLALTSVNTPMGSARFPKGCIKVSNYSEVTMFKRVS